MYIKFIMQVVTLLLFANGMFVTGTCYNTMHTGGILLDDCRALKFDDIASINEGLKNCTVPSGVESQCPFKVLERRNA